MASLGLVTSGSGIFNVPHKHESPLARAQVEFHNIKSQNIHKILLQMHSATSKRNKRQRAVSVLFSAYAQASGGVHLLCLLAQCARVAEEVQQEVVDAGALDSSLLPDLASDVCRGPAVEKRDEVG